MVNAIRKLNLDVYLVIRRILAVGIDSVMLTIIMSWVISSFGSMHVTGGTIPTNYTSIYSVDWYWYPILVFAYFFMQEASFSCTIGKRLMWIKVVDGTGQPITLLATLLRNLLRFVDAIPGFYLLGGIIMLL